jgi:hypothetical protein
MYSVQCPCCSKTLFRSPLVDRAGVIRRFLGDPIVKVTDGRPLVTCPHCGEVVILENALSPSGLPVYELAAEQDCWHTLFDRA